MKVVQRRTDKKGFEKRYYSMKARKTDIPQYFFSTRFHFSLDFFKDNLTFWNLSVNNMYKYGIYILWQFKGFYNNSPIENII